MVCLRCGTENKPRELKGLGLIINPAERDPAIAPGQMLPVRALMCQCGFIELRAAHARVVVEGEAIELMPPEE